MSNPLSTLTVLDLDGNEQPLADFWRDRPAVLVWIRHFG
jgi:hypothetical protein